MEKRYLFTPGPTPVPPEVLAAAWLVLRRGDREVVQFNGPVLELMTEDVVYDDSAWHRPMHGHAEVRESA